MKKMIFAYMLLALLGIGASSCDHKELCYPIPNPATLRVVYDWSNAPEATCQGMCVFFYSLDDADRYYRFDFANTEGGEITLPAGRYKVITYNNDTEVTRFTATNSFEDHYATTRHGDLLEPLYGNGTTSGATTSNGESIMVTPDGLWGCHSEEITIAEPGVKYTIFTDYTDTRGDADATVSTDSEGNQTVTLKPHDMLCHYSYEVRNVDNIDKISRVSGALSGMSGGLTLSDETLNSEAVTLPVGGKTDDATKKITGEFLTFGHNPSNGAKHRMEFFVVMDDGTKYRISEGDNLDVTDQVDKAPDRRHVHIIIDRLQLPSKESHDEGFLPTVDDWGEEHEEIRL